MSSFVRTIQRGAKAKQHYAGRGSKLGVVNPKDPCRAGGKHKAAKPWRAAHKVDAASRKPHLPRFAVVAQPLTPKPAREVRRAAHRARMEARRMKQMQRRSNRAL